MKPYDNNGNLLTYGSLTNSWDYNNRLSSTTVNGIGVTYAYDPGGERVKYSAGATTTVYITEGYEVTASTPTKHIYAGSADGDLIGNVKGSGSGASLYSVHNDHLTGSNVVSNASSTLEELTDYYPYGKIRLDQATSTFKESRKYTGHTYDTDTDLTYAKARYYDGKIGRFESQDPMFQAIGGDLRKFDRNQEQLLFNPQELNSYSYVLNNPLRYKDPTGETWQERVHGSIDATLNFIGNTVAGTVNSAFHPVQTIQNLPNVPASIAQDVAQIKQGLSSDNDYDKGFALTSGLLMIGSLVGPEFRAAKMSALEKLPGSALVCRGGSCSAKEFINSPGVTKSADGTLSGVSVYVQMNKESPQALINMLPEKFKGDARFSTMGELRTVNTGFNPRGKNFNHFELSSQAPDGYSKLFNKTKFQIK